MKRLYEKYHRLQQELESLNWERYQYANFFTFNMITGLGKKYRVTQLKLRILDRILKRQINENI